MEKLDHHVIMDAYRKARSRLIFLDYEGTLTPITSSNNTEIPTERINDLLFALTIDSFNKVVVISKQPKENLEGWFTHLPVTLAAENGGFLRGAKNEWDTLLTASLAWKDTAYQALQALKLRYPGSRVERKHFSLTWHYGSITDKISDGEKKQMLAALRSLAKHNDLIVDDENEAMEFLAPGINKGKFAATWMGNQGRFDFILAIGDSKADEEIFDAIGKEYFTIRVGNSSNSAARYFLNNQERVLPFLSDLLSKDLNSYPVNT